MKRIIISETTRKELRWLVGVIQPSISNPLSMYMMGKLNEGLVMTYPFQTMKKHIMDFFGIPYYDFHENMQNGVLTAVIDIPNDELAIKQVDKAMNFYGYFKSLTGIIDGGQTARLHYEPKFQYDEFDITTEKEIYHISPTRFQNKILRIGFCPYNKNTFFKFPERVYFFRGTYGKETILQYVNAICNSKPNDEIVTEYSLFTLSTELLTNKHFFIDPNMEGAIYTNENISPKVIVDVKQYKI